MLHYFFIIALCSAYSNVGAMDIQEQAVREQNFLSWCLYKPEVQEITYNKPLITPLNGFTKKCSFSCDYKNESNRKICIEKYEKTVSNNPSYSLNIFKCRWEEVYASCSSSDNYFCNTSTGIVKSCDLNMYMLWRPHFRNISCEANLIRSFCVKTAQQKKIPYGSEKCYALSDDLSRVACITNDGVLYVFSPGEGVKMDMPHKLYDTYFRFVMSHF